MRPALWLTVAVVLGGCASGESPVSAAAGARLGAQVDAIRQAAAAGDRAGAELRLAELRQAVTELRAAGELTGATAMRVLDRAAAVETGLASLPTTTTTQLPPSPEHGADDEPKRADEKDEKDREDEEDGDGKD